MLAWIILQFRIRTKGLAFFNSMKVRRLAQYCILDHRLSEYPAAIRPSLVSNFFFKFLIFFIILKFSYIQTFNFFVISFQF